MEYELDCLYNSEFQVLIYLKHGIALGDNSSSFSRVSRRPSRDELEENKVEPFLIRRPVRHLFARERRWVVILCAPW